MIIAREGLLCCWGGHVPAAIQSADVVIVVAGIEDEHSLVNVIAGSTESPVIAVPTTARTTVCPPGVTVVDRNQGLAAAIFAARILRYLPLIIYFLPREQGGIHLIQSFPCDMSILEAYMAFALLFNVNVAQSEPSLSAKFRSIPCLNHKAWSCLRFNILCKVWHKVWSRLPWFNL